MGAEAKRAFAAGEENRLPRVLVVGTRAAFSELFGQLEAAREYQFDYAPYPGTVRLFLLTQPDAVLLELPAEAQAASEALTWLDTLKGKQPVVAMSRGDDMELYLRAMERGAFDFVTDLTPVAEILRVLENAVRSRSARAA